MSNTRILEARAALARAEQQWKGRVSCLSGGASGVISHAFGGLFLGRNISIGGITPIGLHEVICAHDESAASLLAWYLATLPSAPSAGEMAPASAKPVFWIRQRRALDQGGLYALSLPAQALTPPPLMMAVNQQVTALWACEETARSGQVGAVVIETTDYDLTTARRLQLACEAGASRIIVLRPAPRNGALRPSCAWTRWKITPTAPPMSLASPASPAPPAPPVPGTPSASLAGAGHTGQLRPTGTEHRLSLIGGRGVRPGSWKARTDAATFSLSVADALENRLPDDQHAQA